MILNWVPVMVNGKEQGFSTSKSIALSMLHLVLKVLKNANPTTSSNKTPLEEGKMDRKPQQEQRF
jgi:hypothetical protein